MTRSLISRGHGPLAERGLWSDPFFSLQRGINSLFEDVWRGGELPAVFTGSKFPSLEVKDDGKTLTVTAELPGLEPGDVDLSLVDGILTLRGEKKSETSEKTEHGKVSERWYGRFERAVMVGDVDEGKVEAGFDKGVLTVTLPKAEKPKETGRKIPITAR